MLNRQRLSKRQLDSIGCKTQQQIPTYLWDQQIGILFKKYQGKITKNLQNQTFDQFINMDLSGPNQEGNGRYQFKDIELIQFAIIQKKSYQLPTKKSSLKDKKKAKLNSNNKTGQTKAILNSDKCGQKNYKNQQQCDRQLIISIITKLLSGFICLPVKYRSTSLSINSQTHTLIDSSQMIQYEIKKPIPNSFQISSLLDLGLQYKAKYQNQQGKINKYKKKRKILLFLIQSQMVENGVQIDGRAVGDGLAFVTFNRTDFIIQHKSKSIISHQLKQTNLSKSIMSHQQNCYTLLILIHQCLHTLGFDHCSAWQCIMNEVTNQQFGLCPCCLRKLQSEISNKLSIDQWYQGLIETLQQIKVSFQTKYGTIRFKLINSLIQLYSNVNSLLPKRQIVQEKSIVNKEIQLP